LILAITSDGSLITGGDRFSHIEFGSYLSI
jgi:hypothetical protein